MSAKIYTFKAPEGYEPEPSPEQLSALLAKLMGLSILAAVVFSAIISGLGIIALWRIFQGFVS